MLPAIDVLEPPPPTTLHLRLVFSLLFKLATEAPSAILVFSTARLSSAGSGRESTSLTGGLSSERALAAATSAATSAARLLTPLYPPSAHLLFPC